MGSYLANFAIYTMAMFGLIFFALMVYQKFAQNGGIGLQKSNFLKVEETLPMGARKMLYVVRAGNERFLLSSDMDKTSFIAKLDSNNSVIDKKEENSHIIDEFYDRAPSKSQFAENFAVSANNAENTQSVDDIPVIVDFAKKNKVNKSSKVLQNMLYKINE